VDGGKGQLRQAIDILEEMDLNGALTNVSIFAQ